MSGIEDILIQMKKHTEENPGHGINCACKDHFVRMIRGKLNTLGIKEEFNLAAQYIKD